MLHEAALRPLQAKKRPLVNTEKRICRVEGQLRLEDIALRSKKLKQKNLVKKVRNLRKTAQQ
ncbi:hypothetical protein [Psychromonas aquimarina]|uniref:hypothetical protein n=1 Tax=Psychromonas aquimarina TaxID=444919 RepID=UPI0004197CF1|nr:hypothetical protein [Psychromonas aquimarina]